jgi:hypothetical protein
MGEQVVQPGRGDVVAERFQRQCPVAERQLKFLRAQPTTALQAAAVADRRE